MTLLNEKKGSELTVRKLVVIIIVVLVLVLVLALVWKTDSTGWFKNIFPEWGNFTKGDEPVEGFCEVYNFDLTMNNDCKLVVDLDTNCVDGDMFMEVGPSFFYRDKDDNLKKFYEKRITLNGFENYTINNRKFTTTKSYLNYIYNNPPSPEAKEVFYHYFANFKYISKNKDFELEESTNFNYLHIDKPIVLSGDFIYFDGSSRIDANRNGEYYYIKTKKENNRLKILLRYHGQYGPELGKGTLVAEGLYGGEIFVLMKSNQIGNNFKDFFEELRTYSVRYDNSKDEIFLIKNSNPPEGFRIHVYNNRIMVFLDGYFEGIYYDPNKVEFYDYSGNLLAGPEGQVDYRTAGEIYYFLTFKSEGTLSEEGKEQLDRILNEYSLEENSGHFKIVKK